MQSDWIKAGDIAARALCHGRELIKPGKRAEEVLDSVEEFIIKAGGKIAFPAQLSCDHIAAHWCADKDDPLVFKNQVVCLDVGVEVNGCIGDNALTVDLSGRYEKLVEASRKALENAVSVVKPGVKLGEIGKTIKDTITSYGYLPIHNLSGHGLDLYKIHTYPTIPNYDNGDDARLEKGQTIAIEPFATDGAGMIQESSHANIFSFVQKKPVRSPFAREILKEIESYNGLPFTTRWLMRKFPKAKVMIGLKELVAVGVIRQYPPLVEKNKGIVTQSEFSIMVDDEPVILTPWHHIE
ncbi:MAG: type II methionyl aminopeptidase [Candidatus Woesearchaeota archaeon]